MLLFYDRLNGFELIKYYNINMLVFLYPIKTLSLNPKIKAGLEPTAAIV